jgi:hypothetical protein
MQSCVCVCTYHFSKLSLHSRPSQISFALAKIRWKACQSTLLIQTKVAWRLGPEYVQNNLSVVGILQGYVGRNESNLLGSEALNRSYVSSVLISRTAS